MKESNNIVLALDGHDGSGKTTLAKLLAEEIGGIYVRPFAGNQGLKLLQYAEQKEYETLPAFGHQLIQKQLEAHQNQVLVFDRHWMTVFSLLPEAYWSGSAWHPLPHTTLCFSGMECTLERLKERSEEKYGEAYHAHYLEMYLKLGKRFNANILMTDQDDIGKCLVKLVEWYKSL
jgi:thymidylate kinase